MNKEQWVRAFMARVKELIGKATANSLPCPGCGNNSYDPLPLVYWQAIVPDGMDQEKDAGVIPVLPLSCRTCGEIRVFSVQKLGAIADPDQLPKKEDLL
jgi:hypothetical protein